MPLFFHEHQLPLLWNNQWTSGLLVINMAWKNENAWSLYAGKSKQLAMFSDSFLLKLAKAYFCGQVTSAGFLFQYYLISHKIEKRKYKLVRILAVNWFCFIQVSQSWGTSNLIFSHLKQTCTPGPVINNSRFWHFLHVICKKFVSCMLSFPKDIHVERAWSQFK